MCTGGDVGNKDDSYMICMVAGIFNYMQWRSQDEHLGEGGLINRDLEQMSKINGEIMFFLQ